MREIGQRVCTKKRILFFNHSQYAVDRRVTYLMTRKITKEDIISADSFADRDMLCRQLAAEFYARANHLRTLKREKMALQYMKLCAKLLGLSLKPKKLQDLDEIKKALDKLKSKEPDPGFV